MSRDERKFALEIDVTVVPKSRLEAVKAEVDRLRGALREIAGMAEPPDAERWMVDAHDIVARARQALPHPLDKEEG